MHERQSLIRVDIYSRPGCHLCDEAKGTIEQVLRGRNAIVRLIDVESDPELEARYGSEIPVVFINDERAFHYRVDKIELERKIEDLWKT
jgi:glutaredoxin